MLGVDLVNHRQFSFGWEHFTRQYAQHPSYTPRVIIVNRAYCLVRGVDRVQPVLLIYFYETFSRHDKDANLARIDLARMFNHSCVTPSSPAMSVARSPLS